MEDGQEVELLMESESTIKRFEKNNYSAFYNASEPLTKTQIAVLSTLYLDEMKVEWKKRSETYDLDRSQFLINALPTVF